MRRSVHIRTALAVLSCAAAASLAPPAHASGGLQAPDEATRATKTGGLPAGAASAQPPAQPQSDQATPQIVAADVPYGVEIAVTAHRWGIPAALFTALVWQESGFNPKAKSPAGARGLTQLMPATARELGVTKPFDPQQNLDGGAKYLRMQLLTFRTKRLALAAYNAGPGAVRRYGKVPPYAETRAYVKRILAIERQLIAAGVR